MVYRAIEKPIRNYGVYKVRGAVVGTHIINPRLERSYRVISKKHCAFHIGNTYCHIIVRSPRNAEPIPQNYKYKLLIDTGD